MKTKLYSVLFFLLSVTPAYAQWTTVLTAISGISTCHATSRDTCFAAGLEGKIYRTTNGGISWDTVNTIFNTSWFADIYFPSKNIGYTCGGTAFGLHKSMVAKTTDGGTTWDSLTSNLCGYEFSLTHFVNDTLGFFAGECLYKTTNGGQSFTQLFLPFSYGKILGLFFPSANVGYLSTISTVSSTLSISRITKTTDQGQNWQTVYIDSSVGAQKLYFPNDSTGYATGWGYGTLFKTTDGGLNWSIDTLTTDSIIFWDIVFVNSNIGYMAGFEINSGIYSGHVFKTTDGGITWTQHLVTSSYGIFSVSFPTPDTGYAAGGMNEIFKTTNGGVGIENNENKNENYFLLYPNPSYNNVAIHIEIKLNSDFQIQITDITGKQLYFQKYQPAQWKTINLPTMLLPAGMYYISVLSDNLMLQAKKYLKL